MDDTPKTYKLDNLDCFQASSELIKILLLNGFKDITDKRYPNHSERLRYGYDPHKAKRKLIYPGTKCYLLFDYVDIRFGIASSINSSDYQLNINELKSIIVFCKLSASDRRSLRAELNPVKNLYKRIEYLSDQKVYRRKLDERLVAFWRNSELKYDY